jgi:hypothetical protein
MWCAMVTFHKNVARCIIQKKCEGQGSTNFLNVFFYFSHLYSKFSISCSLLAAFDWSCKSLNLEMPQTWFSWPSIASSRKFLFAYTPKWVSIETISAWKWFLLRLSQRGMVVYTHPAFFLSDDSVYFSVDSLRAEMIFPWHSQREIIVFF